MNFKMAPIYVATILCMTSANTFAAANFDPVDPRTLAMGTSSVASANAAFAPFYNPSLLATNQSKIDLFTANLSGAGIAADSQDLFGAFTEFNDAQLVTKFGNSMTQFTNGINTANFNDVSAGKSGLVSNGYALKNGVKNLAGRAMTANISVNGVVAVPHKKTAVAVVGSVWTSFGIVGEFAAADETLVNTILTDVNNVDTSSSANFATWAAGHPSYTPPTFASNNLQSTAYVRGAVVQEFGLAFAREDMIAGKTLAWGVTPKYLKIVTFDQKLTGDGLVAPKIDYKAASKDETGFNIDVGAAHEYNDHIKTGVVIRNLIPMSYKTTLGNTIKSSPAARVGGMYYSDRYSVSADLDLTENSPFGLGAASRILALGGELDLWLLKLRAGYRFDIAVPENSFSTAGLGLDLWLAHLDLAMGFGGSAVEVNGVPLNIAAELGIKW